MTMFLTNPACGNLRMLRVPPLAILHLYNLDGLAATYARPRPKFLGLTSTTSLAKLERALPGTTSALKVG